MSEKILYLNYTHPKIKTLTKEIIKTLKKNIKQPFKVFLFGSFATGKATYFSDLDIAIETKENLENKHLYKIKEELEKIRTLRKIDLVYINKAPDSLKEVINKEGILIYGS
ncbi:type VII toxin-antitoxin system MntA family adenylyltransferase antitoxin [Hydrogenobaculum sp.]